MSTEEYETIIKKQVDAISKKCEVFCNPARALTMSIIVAKGEIAWTELKEKVEGIIGNQINPNTLSFHIGRLISAGYILKIGTKEQPIYKIAENETNEYKPYIHVLVKALKERFQE